MAEYAAEQHTALVSSTSCKGIGFKPANLGQRAFFLVHRGPANGPAAQAPKLAELLAANQALMTVYVMKASLKELWQPTDPWQWRVAWQDMALSSGIEPLIRFAKRLRPYWRGILARM